MYETIYMRYLEQPQSERPKVEQWLPGPGALRKWGLLLLGTKFSVRDAEGVPEMDGGEGCT